MKTCDWEGRGEAALKPLTHPPTTPHPTRGPALWEVLNSSPSEPGGLISTTKGTCLWAMGHQGIGALGTQGEAGMRRSVE